MNDNSEILQADGFQVEVIRTDRKKTLSVKVLAGRVEVRRRVGSAKNCCSNRAGSRSWLSVM